MLCWPISLCSPPRPLPDQRAGPRRAGNPAWRRRGRLGFVVPADHAPPASWNSRCRRSVDPSLQEEVTPVTLSPHPPPRPLRRAVLRAGTRLRPGLRLVLVLGLLLAVLGYQAAQAAPS